MDDLSSIFSKFLRRYLNDSNGLNNCTEGVRRKESAADQGRALGNLTIPDAGQEVFYGGLEEKTR